MGESSHLEVQGALKSLQHHSSKASVLQCSAFFILQLSHPYMSTGKTIALTIWTFVSKVKSLLFNMLFRLVKSFLPRSKHLLISWLQSPCAVILEPKKIKSGIVSIVTPSICQGCGWNSRASSRVETGMSGNFLSCSKGVKDPLEVPEVRCN